MLKSVALLIGVLAVSGACDARIANHKKAALQTICEAAARPVGSAGLKVELEAEYISDRMERAMLQDEKCPGITVVPYDGPRLVKNKAYRDFSRQISANPLQVGLLKMHIKVYGTLKREAPNKYRLDVIRYIGSAKQKAR